MRGFLRLLLFVIVGPYLGLMAMSLTIGSYTYATTGSTRDFIYGDDLMEPWLLIVTYTIGFLPALLAGIVAIFVARRVSGWRYWLWMALVGAVPSFALAALLASGGPEMSGTNGMLPVLVGVTFAGGAAAFICAAVFDALASLAGDRDAV